ncbi:hypothetical protein FVF58_44435 [Paraburkholderia panacisoli]|uniref:Uncharacterized protein n=1 Tax=Paraburkholderia panacisoli TaxID=2603818 RepID=A0A5B0G7E5_9BURK|nr:hypothetical protein FVF58_44435 [Paraburkholderia panacisoli]
MTNSTSVELLTELEHRDRALSAGLATKAIAWCGSAQLARFRPAFAVDGHGNEVFYQGGRLGLSAEAYVRGSGRKMSRLRISRVAGLGDGKSVRRPYDAVLFSFLTPAGSHRISFVVASQAPPALTIGLSLPDKPVATIRVLLTPDAHGFFSPSISGAIHEGDWSPPSDGHRDEGENDRARVAG